jgi:hypothetical protein
MFETRIEELRKIDPWAPSQYLGYYTKLMPTLKKWYNVPEGYRPVVMGRNISWWLGMGETRRKCRCYNACPEEKDVTKESMHMVLTQTYNDRMSCWTCEFNQKRLLSSGWERYYNISSRILWTIDMVESKMGMLSTIRSMYWQPAIRDYNLRDRPTDKSWNEITALNMVFDIDIIDKNNRSIFEKEIWDGLFDMLDDVGGMLEDEDIGYKIQFSGNGCYFITNKIVEKDEIDEGESREEFWNIVSAGWANWINSDVKKLEEKHKNFTIDGREPYTMMFLKTPFSLHQRLDVSAIPISIDMIGEITSGEFSELCNPDYVINNVDEMLKVWK